MNCQVTFAASMLLAVWWTAFQPLSAADTSRRSERAEHPSIRLRSNATLTETSFGGVVFPVVPSPAIYNLTVANCVTDWNMAVQWVVQDSNSSLIGNRVFALTHLAIWRALEANREERTPARDEAVVSYAAHLALSNNYPFYYYRFDDLLRLQTSKFTDKQKDAAMKVAWPCVVILLRARLDDGTQQWLNYKPPNSTEPGTFRVLEPPQDFLAATSTLPQGVPQLAISKPFVLPFRISQTELVRNVPPPLPIPSPSYDHEYNLVKKYGAANSTARSKNESNLAVIWGDSYTESAGLSAYWMRIALSTLPKNVTLRQTAQLLAVLACAQFDANVVVYNQKYRWNYWRPVTGIQLGDPQHAPDPSWQANVLSQNNPSYPSKLGGVSGASAAILNSFYTWWGHYPSFKIGTEQPLPYPDLLPIRSYSSISEAEREAVQSRIYTGQEYLFSVKEGEIIGQEVAKYVLGHMDSL